MQKVSKRINDLYWYYTLRCIFVEYLGKTQPAKDSLAQLIADSTEKKFSFNNLFKGIWKKKQAQYTFGDM